MNTRIEGITEDSELVIERSLSQGHTGTGDSPCTIRYEMSEIMRHRGGYQNRPESIDETEKNDSIGIEDLPFYTRVEAVVVGLNLGLCKLASASLREGEATVGLLNDLCLDDGQSFLPG